MSIINKNTQYQEPSYYWNHYGYYEYYGPHTDLSMYKPLNITTNATNVENYLTNSGGFSNAKVIGCFVLVGVLVSFFCIF